MYRGLIDNLTFVYSFICKGRGKLTEAEMQAISGGAHTLTDKAPAVLGSEDETASDRADLAEARKIDEHIEEMTIFLQSLEIV